MKRSNLILLITGIVGATANILAIISYFDEAGFLAARRPDPGWLLALSFVTLAYLLTMWSALAWRWTRRPGRKPAEGSRRTSLFLLNALATFPLLAFWLYLLSSSVLFADAPSADRWLLALAVAWVATPFGALGLVSVGEVLGPLIASRK